MVEVQQARARQLEPSGEAGLILCPLSEVREAIAARLRLELLRGYERMGVDLGVERVLKPGIRLAHECN